MSEQPHEYFWETAMPADEFERRERASRAALEGPQGDEMRALLEWFVRRYPTPLARLAYIRRKTREAGALRGKLTPGR